MSLRALPRFVVKVSWNKIYPYIFKLKNGHYVRVLSHNGSDETQYAVVWEMTVIFRMLYSVATRIG